MHTNRCDKTSEQKCHAKGSTKETKNMYKDTWNVEHEMYDYTGNNWNQRNSNERFNEKSESHTSNTFNRFATKNSCTCNITHNTERTAVWNLKVEQWESPLVQEHKYRRKKACDSSSSSSLNKNRKRNYYYYYYHHHHTAF